VGGALPFVVQETAGVHVESQSVELPHERPQPAPQVSWHDDVASPHQLLQPPGQAEIAQCAPGAVQT